MAADATPPDAPEVAPKPDSSGLDWRRAALVAIGLGLTLSIGRGLAESTLPAQAVRFAMSLEALGWLIVAALVAIVLFALAVRYFRLSRLVVASVVGIVAAAFFVASHFVRIESFSGNLFPRLAWRSTPTAEERFRAWQAEQDARRAAAAREVGTATPAATTDATSEVSTLPPVAPTAHDFPQFLGPARTGVLPSAAANLDWKNHPPRELWRHPVGPGWGGFAVVGNHAFTQEQRGDDECVVAYDLTNGRELWAHADKTRFAETHGDGPRATPTFHDGRLFTMGATGIVNCLDAATGRPLWKYVALPDPATQNLQWGMSGSPLVHGDAVVVAPGLPGKSLIALRRETGDVLWNAGDDPAAYSSPLLAELAGVRQILIFNGAGLRGHDAKDGKPLWLFPWVTMGSQRVNVAQPVVLSQFGEPHGESLVLISSGYSMGAALVRVAQRGDELVAEEVWKSKQLKSKFSNFVVHRGGVFGLDDGILCGLDLATGSRKWKSGRYGHGQLLLVGDELWIQAEEGEVVLVAPSLERAEERAVFPALTSKTWNHPTLAGRVLLVRNDREAAAFELAPNPTP